jgi:hypothetical protein
VPRDRDLVSTVDEMLITGVASSRLLELSFPSWAENAPPEGRISALRSGAPCRQQFPSYLL